MKKFAIAALVSLGLISSATAAEVKIGTLTCRIDGGIGFLVGSSKTGVCQYNGYDNSSQIYDIDVNKLGLDLGVTGDTILVWAVFAPGKAAPDSLEGYYVGASAEASLGPGIGANVLIGGFDKSFALQPVSVQGQTGINVSLTGTTVQLSGRR